MASKEQSSLDRENIAYLAREYSSALRIAAEAEYTSAYRLRRAFEVYFMDERGMNIDAARERTDEVFRKMHAYRLKHTLARANAAGGAE